MEKENLEKLKKLICEDYITAKKNLYTKICNKLKSFHTKKEKMKLRGFNDFNYINLLVGFTDENSHSKIIAELLNPYGSHYQGELFLENFFEVLNFKSNNLKEWEIFTEFFVDNVTGKGQGRIDILLKNKKENKFILIENKIYAGDQNSQIYKYVEYLYSEFKIKNYDDLLVVYLTPFERKISDESLGKVYKVENKYLIDISNKQKKALFKNITYNKEILEWIEKSLKEVENICSLKESLKQYQQVVSYITNKKGDIMNLEEYLKKLLEGNEEEREIVKTLIVNFEDFKKYIDEKCLKIIEDENLEKVIENIKKFIRKLIIEKIKESIEKDLSSKFEIQDFNFGNKYAPLIVFKNSWKKCNKNIPLLHYALELDKWEYKGLYYGIKKCDKDIPYKDNDIPDKLKQINEITGSKSSPWWVSWKWFESPYNIFKGDEKEFYIEVINEFHKLDEFIKKHYTKPLLDYINQTTPILEEYYKTT